MRLLYHIGCIALFILSCKNRDASEQAKDTIKPLQQMDSSRVSNLSPGKLCFVVRAYVEAPAFSISFISKYKFPLDSLLPDSGIYFVGNYVTVTKKSNKTTDTIEVEGDENHSPCFHCVILRDLTDSLHIYPLFIQVVTPGEDLSLNSFFGYRGRRLQELFALGDTEGDGVLLKKTGDSGLSGFTYGVDEVVGGVGHNYPVSVDLKNFKVRHPLPAIQYIGFRTAATEDFRAYTVPNARMDSVLYNVGRGDSLTIDTFYRAAKRVGLLIGDSIRVEIKLETARKKLWRPAPAG
jgi:hypothetical protein